MSISNIRSRFPFYDNPGVLYLDSAATTQKPDSVIRAVQDYLRQVANPGRSSYPLAESIRHRIEEVRAQTARFFGANDPDSIIFTAGCTSALNLLALGLRDTLAPGDEVLVHRNDHKACILPWMHFPEVNIVEYAVNPFNGTIDGADLLAKISKKTRIVVLTHSNNIYGVLNPIREISRAIPDNCFVIVDGAQSAGHCPVNVSEIGADAFACSGHKMFSLEGVGIVWTSNRLRSLLRPVQFGGGSHPFEPGTINATGIISFGAALSFLEEVGLDAIDKHIHTLTRYGVDQLSALGCIDFLPGFAYDKTQRPTGIVSFRVPGLSSVDLAYQLAQKRIYVRAGSHCSSGSEAALDSVRISLHVYNTTDELDILTDALRCSIAS
ncbi:MAG: aminotransferase class V-fold PLP-dependent enzyme [Patescibacteria group bacterium]|nr:aminotransferase class V-fold PLP-dependent enzyme [Patescibacteria group bacterium]